MLARLVKFQTAMFHAKNADRGATAVEYGLMVALIAGIIVLAVTTLGGTVRDIFTDVNAKV
jgi:pilus assembly protein Flp/PilA